MAKKPKKHEILGGVKVSSKQLSEWGKSGGRPRKHTNNAERARAYRLRKKQEKFGKGAQLRPYRAYENLVEIKSSLEMICDKCQAKVIGGPQHLGEQCYRCFWGRMVRKE